MSKGSTLPSRPPTKNDPRDIRDHRKGGGGGSTGNVGNSHSLTSIKTKSSASSFSTSTPVNKCMLLQVVAARFSTLVLCRSDPDANTNAYQLHYPHPINEVY